MPIPRNLGFGLTYNQLTKGIDCFCGKSFVPKDTDDWRRTDEAAWEHADVHYFYRCEECSHITKAAGTMIRHCIDNGHTSYTNAQGKLVIRKN